MNIKEEFERARRRLGKLIAGGGLVFGLNASSPVQAETTTEYDFNNVRTEKTIENTPNSSAEMVSKAKTSYTPIKLEKYSDIEKLFDMSLNIIFAELVLEEVPMQNMYDDYGLYSGGKNTVGVGSTYMPKNMKDYDNPEAKWWHLYTNPNTFAGTTASYEMMLQLVIGWGKYRKYTQNPESKEFEQRPVILKRMFDKLQGTSLRPNEFSALFCAVYNNEGNINYLCSYVKKYHSNPVDCANRIMTWWKNGPANKGTKDRCEFEVCVYLNPNNFCENMLDMYTCPSKRASCINAESVIQKNLTKSNYEDWVKKAMKSYLEVNYGKSGKKTGDICSAVATKGYFKNPLKVLPKVKDDNTDNKNYEKLYADAKTLYNKKEYSLALKKFLEIEKHGSKGADLLNDIAVTYLSLGKYQECISYCQNVLKTGEKQEYAKACYNAGQAYEKQNNYTRAIANYTKASEYYKSYGIAGAKSDVDYEKIYASALKNVQAKQNMVLKNSTNIKNS
jgi:hypothetical protein